MHHKNSSSSLLVLGTAQDGGYPHTGCSEDCCREAWKDSSQKRLIASLAVLDANDCFLIDITPDFEDEQYRVRAIDFDQQCYEGRKNMYLPQFFKENYKIVKFCADVMNAETVEQYQQEERVLIRRRYETAQHRFGQLSKCMCNDTISNKDKIEQLKLELKKHHKTSFNSCKKMGEVLDRHLELMLTKD